MPEGRPRHDRHDHRRSGSDGERMQVERRKFESAEEHERLESEAHRQPEVGEMQRPNDGQGERTQSLPLLMGLRSDIDERPSRWKAGLIMPLHARTRLCSTPQPSTLP